MTKQNSTAQLFRSMRYGNIVRLRHAEPFVWLVETEEGDVLSSHQTDVQARAWWRLEEPRIGPRQMDEDGTLDYYGDVLPEVLSSRCIGRLPS